MRHDFSLSDFNIRLRPVALVDAEFVLRLGTLRHVLGTVGDTVPSVAAQKQWLQTYFGRDASFYAFQ